MFGHEAHVKVNEDLNRIKKIEPVHTITQLTHPTTKQGAKKMQTNNVVAFYLSLNHFLFTHVTIN